MIWGDIFFEYLYTNIIKQYHNELKLYKYFHILYINNISIIYF